MKTEPVHGSVILHDGKLTIKRPIRGKLVVTEYLMEEIQAHPDVATPPTWRLSKIEPSGEISEVYDIRLTPEGWWECDCKDHLCRRRYCKHQLALAAVGKIPAMPRAVVSDYPSDQETP